MLDVCGAKNQNFFSDLFLCFYSFWSCWWRLQLSKWEKDLLSKCGSGKDWGRSGGSCCLRLMCAWRVMWESLTGFPSGPWFGIFCELKAFPIRFISMAAFFFLPCKNTGNSQCVNAQFISMKPCNVSRSGNLLYYRWALVRADLNGSLELNWQQEPCFIVSCQKSERHPAPYQGTVLLSQGLGHSPGATCPQCCFHVVNSSFLGRFV